MTHKQSTEQDGAEALGALVIAIFRANGALLAWGDRLVAADGLTSARWQVLGAIAQAGSGLTVPAIARTMGLTRQAVQKQVDSLRGAGLLVLRDNPEHQRSPLVQLTARGQRTFDQVNRRWRAAARELARPLGAAAVARARSTLHALTDRLGHTQDQEEPDETESDRR